MEPIFSLFFNHQFYPVKFFEEKERSEFIWGDNPKAIINFTPLNSEGQRSGFNRGSMAEPNKLF
jgi:hypothetical protein